MNIDPHRCQLSARGEAREVQRREDTERRP
jgi:hypothetical protein